MALSSRSILQTASPAHVTWNSCKFWTESDIAVRIAPEWQPINTSMFGEIDKMKSDTVVKVALRLWGAWENLATLFPAALISPTIGTSIYGTTDLPLVIHSRNTDRLTLHNAQITKMADLHLGRDQNCFAADVEFTGILATNKAPGASASYFTWDTAAYSETGFSKTAFSRPIWTAAWGAVTGFTAIIPRDGFKLGWNLGLTPIRVDGYGTVDMVIQSFEAQLSCLPIGPTSAQLVTNQAADSANGVLAAAEAADMVVTASNNYVFTLKGAFIAETGMVFSPIVQRIGETVWRTTRGFTAGVSNDIVTLTVPV